MKSNFSRLKLPSRREGTGGRGGGRQQWWVGSGGKGRWAMVTGIADILIQPTVVVVVVVVIAGVVVVVVVV